MSISRYSRSGGGTHNVTDLELVATASAYAAHAHRSQVRKILNEPYIEHPLRVAATLALFGEPATHIAAGALHDVVEDTDSTMEDLRKIFPETTIDLVSALTKWWPDDSPRDVVQLNKPRYYHRIRHMPGAALIKIVDRTDNMRDFTRMVKMDPTRSTIRWAANYATKTAIEFDDELIMAAGHPKAIREFTRALDELRDTVVDKHFEQFKSEAVNGET